MKIIYNPKGYSLKDGEVAIRTNFHWKDPVRLDEMTVEQLETVDAAYGADAGFADDDEFLFVKKGVVVFTGELSLSAADLEGREGWNFHSESFFSGIAWRWKIDHYGDLMYQLGTYWC